MDCVYMRRNIGLSVPNSLAVSEGWGKLHNLYCSSSTVSINTYKTMRWTVHVARMGNFFQISRSERRYCIAYIVRGRHIMFKYFCDKCVSQIGLSFLSSCWVGEWITCIWEMLGSDLTRVTGYPETFPLEVEADAGKIFWRKTRPLLPLFPT
jgi:hypothetical protein